MSWRELRRAGIEAHLAEPEETAAALGRKRQARLPTYPVSVPRWPTGPGLSARHAAESGSGRDQACRDLGRQGLARADRTCSRTSTGSPGRS
jgi:hypothetical protein